MEQSALEPFALVQYGVDVTESAACESAEPGAFHGAALVGFHVATALALHEAPYHESIDSALSAAELPVQYGSNCYGYRTDGSVRSV